jgi:hypothetical protein
MCSRTVSDDIPLVKSRDKAANFGVSSVKCQKILKHASKWHIKSNGFGNWNLIKFTNNDRAYKPFQLSARAYGIQN